MPTSNSQMIYKLQLALNSKGLKILNNRSQFYSEEQKRPVTLYKVSQSRTDEITGKTKHVELFNSYSQIQIVLFLRNLWFACNGKPIPPTNEIKGAEMFQRKWDDFAETELKQTLHI